MKWGVTEPITDGQVCQHCAYVRANKGEIISIVFVGAAVASQIVGGDQTRIDQFRVFYNLPSEQDNGAGAIESKVLQCRIPDEEQTDGQ